MTNMQPYRGGLAGGAGRELARLSDRTDVEIARTNSAAEVDTARLDGLQLVGTRAMQGVAMVSQLEGQLATMVPLATSRLQAIGDMHALASAEVVSQAARRGCR